MLSVILTALLITIPAIGLQTQAEPDEQPANLVFVGDFERLAELNPYDAVSVTDEAGMEQDYVVAWSRLYPKGSLPPEVTDGPASGGQVVTLIADEASDDYGYPVQRVVRAVPLP